ncbi:MAG TPA: hypothetical protein VGG06_20780 [Thermoanaerobaculia bacterium]|jgi:uncharacterized membrane protein YfcA
MSHLLLMSTYAALISVFFAVLWRREPRAQLKLFLQLFLGLVLGAVALAWLTYPFPAGAPAPIP